MENNLMELIIGLVTAITGLITYWVKKSKKKGR